MRNDIYATVDMLYKISSNVCNLPHSHSRNTCHVCLNVNSAIVFFLPVVFLSPLYESPCAHYDQLPCWESPTTNEVPRLSGSDILGMSLR